jgi:hypothetical protein
MGFTAKVGQVGLPQRHIPVEQRRTGLHYSVIRFGVYRYGNEAGVNIYAGGDRAIC